MHSGAPVHPMTACLMANHHFPARQGTTGQGYSSSALALPPTTPPLSSDGGRAKFSGAPSYCLVPPTAHVKNQGGGMLACGRATDITTRLKIRAGFMATRVLPDMKSRNKSRHGRLTEQDLPEKTMSHGMLQCSRYLPVALESASRAVISLCCAAGLGQLVIRPSTYHQASLPGSTWQRKRPCKAAARSALQ